MRQWKTLWKLFQVKDPVETLLTTNAQLAKKLSEKYATITRLTKKMSNLVNIITKIASKNNTTNSINNKAGNYHSTGQGQKIQKIPHSIKMDTAGHKVIVYISITAAQTASTSRRDTRRRQLVKNQWEGRTKKRLGQRTMTIQTRGEKIRRD